jgi:hypothetical protein
LCAAAPKERRQLHRAEIDECCRDSQDILTKIVKRPQPVERSSLSFDKSGATIVDG